MHVKYRIVLSYCKHFTCKGWYISKTTFVRLFSEEKREEGLDYIDYTGDYLTSIDECRINYCWNKLCLFLGVRSEVHWSSHRFSCTRKLWRVSVPASKQCSPELVSPSSQCPFIQKFMFIFIILCLCLHKTYHARDLRLAL